MTFLELLKPQAVKVVAAASSKKRLMHDIAELAGSAYGLSAPAAVEALMERESLGPTGVGHGVALPHARVSGIDEVRGVFILLEKPVEFESVDRQPVDVILALFAPEEAGVEHLKALALVSRTLRDATLCNKLRANPDPATLHAILTEDRSSQAA
ncbi:MAG: PTS sugar transporter subunit IIA [Salipiger thiooxidans]|jgi:PTS system nitrogen regulatory IIA component|uniref:PTS IIA-like nitrogen-regulatory protein PtsN n=1 Tax=Salipiger thiooxidans TaxID=282683 RepID=A0A1G7CVA6_9RHOB|nr:MULTISPECIES: PTS sugar transporter subunit IIA [Salipiger]EEX13442.1 putative phosphoenolpyruvate-dependent sugar phosphotransferase system eiia 2 [Citreicella sp. SE45]MAU47619.1 PTS lactose transporter subunit IIC [Salipiger sp.]MAZ26329.1 PTS lactose transporter subunit IIC [Cytophagaceae bacterium]MBR9837435.1 PTS transporter subunit EIIA [Paracoccaceae bacterium]MBN8185191.1 PTS sugar transporter subunit IIA [Salipiger thiooxidans]